MEIQPRCEGLSVDRFVEPKIGKTHRDFIPRGNPRCPDLVDRYFARPRDALGNKIVLAGQDRAVPRQGDRVTLPAGIIPEYPPACSPENRPARRLRGRVDQPPADRHFEIIEKREEVLSEGGRDPRTMTEAIKNLIGYHRFPDA